MKWPALPIQIQILFKQTTILMISCLYATYALAWGSRGHAIIARTAVRTMVLPPFEDKFAKPFLDKEEMIGFLANVPDVSWKSKQDLRSQLDPIHRFLVDAVVKDPSFNKIPLEISKLTKLLDKNCLISSTIASTPPCYKGTNASKLRQIGLSPWSVAQHWTTMTKKFSSIQKSFSKQDEASVNEALLAAGIMSHYVGDMANPNHASLDYDGELVERPGVHAYFEENIVDVLPESLEHEVAVYIATHSPFEKRILNKIPLDRQKDPVSIIIALGIDSHHHLQQVNSLDKQFAWTGKEPNKRKNPKEVMGHFHPLIVERLALAADTLRHLWLYAWHKGESPDLKSYASYYFAIDPQPIFPDYLPID